mgnify:CR=1 FL=1
MCTRPTKRRRAPSRSLALTTSARCNFARHFALVARVNCRAWDSVMSLVDPLIADCARVVGRFHELTDDVCCRKYFCLHYSGDRTRARAFANDNIDAWTVEKGAKDVHTLRWHFLYGRSLDSDLGLRVMRDVFIECRDALGRTHELTRKSKRQELSWSLLMYTANSSSSNSRNHSYSPATYPREEGVR